MVKDIEQLKNEIIGAISNCGDENELYIELEYYKNHVGNE